jgi:hypothetical protein
MENDEVRMKKLEGMSNDQMTKIAATASACFAGDIRFRERKRTAWGQ